MLTVLATHKKAKGHKETFGGDGYVFYLDCDDGILGIPNSSNYAH